MRKKPVSTTTPATKAQPVGQKHPSPHVRRDDDGDLHDPITFFRRRYHDDEPIDLGPFDRLRRYDET